MFSMKFDIRNWMQIFSTYGSKHISWPTADLNVVTNSIPESENVNTRVRHIDPIWDQQSKPWMGEGRHSQEQKCNKILHGAE